MGAAAATWTGVAGAVAAPGMWCRWITSFRSRSAAAPTPAISVCSAPPITATAMRTKATGRTALPPARSPLGYRCERQARLCVSAALCRRCAPAHVTEPHRTTWRRRVCCRHPRIPDAAFEQQPSGGPPVIDVSAHGGPGARARLRAVRRQGRVLAVPGERRALHSGRWRSSCRSPRRWISCSRKQDG